MGKTTFDGSASWNLKLLTHSERVINPLFSFYGRTSENNSGKPTAWKMYLPIFHDKGVKIRQGTPFNQM